MAGIADKIPVVLVRKVVSQNAQGNYDPPTEERYRTWAKVKPRGSNRQFNSQSQLQDTKELEIEFRFDYYPGVDWKVEMRGKLWTVTGVELKDEKQFSWTVTVSSKNVNIPSEDSGS